MMMMMPVHLWAKKHWNFPEQDSILQQKKYYTYQWWHLLQAARRAYMQSWSAVVKVMTFLSPFSQWELSVSGETGNSLFSKDVYSPSIYLDPQPPPSQFSRHIIRGFNDRKKYEEIEGCEQSSNTLMRDGLPNIIALRTVKACQMYR